jgi:C-terminal peptidase prc
VLPGDVIIEADTFILVGLEANKALQVIRGKENSILSARIYRPATQDTINFEIIRKRIEFLHIPFAGFTPDSAVYIRLLDFNAGSAGDFKNSLDSLIPEDQSKVRGIIIDLRGNPGGLFSEARNIAELFLKKGEFIVGTSARSKWNEESYTADKSGIYADLAVSILIDNGSASAAEILAGTLKYSGHAVLVGDTTYGKGLVQGFVHLPEGDGLRLTISRYFFEGGRYINHLDSAAKAHGFGISPDSFYTFIENDPFYQELEWKMILLRFAHKHQDELISMINDNNAKQVWLELLRKFAYENNFKYKSDVTRSAELLVLDCETATSRELAQRVARLANSEDAKLFEKYGDYLWMRLCQIAYERKFGTYKAYRDIVVPNYEPIKIASKSLSRKDPS